MAQTSSALPSTTSAIHFVPALNGSLIDSDACSVAICSLEYAQLLYIPSLAGNLAYLIIFAVLLLIHAVLLPLYRTWGFSIGIICGLLLEIVGYVGRVRLHDNVFSFDYFVIYLVCLTIAPAFITASIYLCLSRIVMVHGEKVARFSPKTYTLTFICCDIISLVLQAAGGAIAATADGGSAEQHSGINTMIGGLAFQVVSMFLFIVLGADLAISIYRAQRYELDQAFTNLRSRLVFRSFPFALALATIAIFIRCCFRVAELQDGFGGELANDQTLFMVFEGPMIMIAVIALTIAHPGICFGGAKGWQAANWTWKRKAGTTSAEISSSTYHTKQEAASASSLSH